MSGASGAGAGAGAGAVELPARPVFVLDGRPVPVEPGDTIAAAVLRTGEVPGTGGALCLAGDCPNCLCVVDGEAYVRTCLAPARPGLDVRRHPASRLRERSGRRC